MIKTGFYNNLTVIKFAKHGAYLIDKDQPELEILIPAKYLHSGVKEGDIIKVFVYRDSEDRLIATTQTPYTTADQFAFLMVKEITPIGAFLDWGIEKDLLVPGNQIIFKLFPGRKYVFRVLVDTVSDRIIATSKLRPFFDKNISDLQPKQKVHAMIYENTPNGAMAIIDGKYNGMIHKNEFKIKPAIGTIYTAYIANISISEKKIDISLIPPLTDSIETSRNMILEKLEKAGGFLPFHDKSEPEDIWNNFSLSKNNFKRLIGNLMKKNKIEISDKGITLKKKT